MGCKFPDAVMDALVCGLQNAQQKLLFSLIESILVCQLIDIVFHMDPSFLVIMG